jgi:hypothetical protein
VRREAFSDVGLKGTAGELMGVGILKVFEDRVLRGIFGSKRDEVTGGWGKLNNNELHDLCSSLSIIRIIESRRMRCAWHVAGMGSRGTRIGYWWESQR